MGIKQPFDGKMIGISNYSLDQYTSKSNTQGELPICYQTTTTFLCICESHKLGTPNCTCDRGFYEANETTIISCGISGGGTTDPTGDPNNGGGSGNPDGSTFNPDFPVFDDPNYINKVKTNYFWEAIGDAKRIWVNSNFTTQEIYKRLIDYQIEQKWSILSRENSIWAIDIYQEKSDKNIEDVKDLVYKVIVDPSFKNNPCLYGVYKQLGQAPTFQNYLQKFDGNFSVANLSLMASNNLPNNLNAKTTSPVNYQITITFNENNLNRPALSITRTFIHEMIHAEIYRKLLSVAGKPEIQFNQAQLLQLKDNYPGLYDYYMRYKFNIPLGQTPTEPQHEAMAMHYRSIIEQVLREYDNSLPQSLYQALAWEGLKNTIAWNKLSSTEKTNIDTIIANFESSNINCK